MSINQVKSDHIRFSTLLFVYLNIIWLNAYLYVILNLRLNLINFQ